MLDDCGQCRSLFADYLLATRQHSDVVSELSRALSIEDLTAVRRIRPLLEGSRDALLTAKSDYERHVRSHD
jgi:hypothetical protein